MPSLLGMAATLVEIGVAIEHNKKQALEFACQIVEDEAKRVIGTYDYGWADLADATQDDRVRKGYAPDDPLLRRGELRDSIEHQVPNQHAGYVGSDLDIAVYQEMGTRTIPPRSFLAGAAAHKGQEIASKIGEVLFSGIGAAKVGP